VNDHDRFREMSAGFVLGALETEDRHAFEGHLADCADCQRDVASYAPIPSLLSRVSDLKVERIPDRVVDGAAARARSEWLALARSRRWWRRSAVVAAVVALVLSVAALRPDPAETPGTPLVVQPGPVSGDVSIDSRAWGTYVHLEIAGLPEMDRYVVWVVADTGEWQQAATWGPTSRGFARLGGASSIAVEDVASVVVTDGDRSETLLTAIPG